MTARSFIGCMGGLFLGGVLLVAAWAKAIHPAAFADQIEGLGIAFLGPLPTALFAIGLEVFLGVALVLGVRRWWILGPSAGLVAFFLYLTGRQYWLWSRGELEAGADCGCFGALWERTPAEAFWTDLALLLPALLLAFVGRSGSRSGTSRPARARRRTITAAFAALVGVGFAYAAPDLPLDDLATRLKPGVAITDLCAGTEGQPDRICLDALVPELEQGTHWVVLADLEDAALEGEMGSLNELYLEGQAADPPVGTWIVTASLPEQVRAFEWRAAPALPVREAPEALVAPLFRKLPRTFRVVDGWVEETTEGLPPRTP